MVVVAVMLQNIESLMEVMAVNVWTNIIIQEPINYASHAIINVKNAQLVLLIVWLVEIIVKLLLHVRVLIIFMMMVVVKHVQHVILVVLLVLWYLNVIHVILQLHLDNL